MKKFVSNKTKGKTSINSDITNPNFNDGSARQLAEIQLKKFLTCKKPEKRLQKRKKWLLIPPSVRHYVKLCLLEKLGTEITTKRNLTPACVAAIACAELPHNQWPGLVDTLIRKANHISSTDVMKEATINTLGFLCKDVKAGVIAQYLRPIFKITIQGMRYKKSNYVKLAATKTLIRSLRLLREILEEDSARAVLMNTICELSNSHRSKIKIAGLTCLIKLATLYYEYLFEEMGPELLMVATNAIKSDVNRVKQKGIQFWVSVCLKERQLQKTSNHGTSICSSSFFSKEVMENLVPLLLNALAKQLTDVNEQSSFTWICMIAHNCLSFMAACCGDQIVRHVLDFVKKHLINPDWRHRYAAVSVFGAVFAGPKGECLRPLLDIIIPQLPRLLQDENVILKQSVAYSVKSMCDSLCKIQLPEYHISALINLFIHCFTPEADRDSAFVVCKLIRSLTTGVTTTKKELVPCHLSQYYGVVVKKLLEVIVTSKPTPTKNNVRKFACSTLNFVTSNCPTECYHSIKEILGVVLNALRKDCNPIVVLPILNVVLRKLKLEDVRTKSDDIMSVLFKVLRKNEANWEKIAPRIFVTIGIFVSRIQMDFIKYMRDFLPILKFCLKKQSKRKGYKSVLRLIRDIARAFGTNMICYCDDLILLLVEGFQKTQLRSIQVYILAVLLEIASNIECHLIKHVMTFINLLRVASKSELKMETKKTELTQSDRNHLNKYREKCLKLYVTVLSEVENSGISITSGDVYVLKSHINDMIAILNLVASDCNSSDSCVQAACELLRLIFSLYGKDAKYLMDNQVIRRFMDSLTVYRIKN